MSLGARFHYDRRSELMQRMALSSVAIIRTPKHAEACNNQMVPYRPSSNFYYLTGLDEPEAVLFIVVGNRKVRSVLFCQERSSTGVQWIDPPLGPTAAKRRLGVDDAYPLSMLNTKAPELLKGARRLYVSYDDDPEWRRTISDWILVSSLPTYAERYELNELIEELRVFKTPEEIAVLRTAASITASGHLHAMQVCQPGMKEYELEAELESTFRKAGANRIPSYPSIVAGGKNALTLHYQRNGDALKHGTLVLVDAGCQFNWYASDVTRTFPVNGIFSPEQKVIYELVLRAQMKAIECVQPGRSFLDVHMEAIHTLTDGLIELSIVKGRREDLVQKILLRELPFFPHQTSHFVGLDVHDVGQKKLSTGASRPLEPKMVLTVEPGLYIPKCSTVEPRWHNIGVRIEDTILVTQDGHQILSSQAPKTVDAIEQIAKTHKIPPK